MYLNAYQKYIDELLDEYGGLLISQLLVMVNFKFGAELENLDGFISQMVRYGDYEKMHVGKEFALVPKGREPDFDVIRSFSVMVAFLPDVIWHRKSRDYVSIRFFVSTLKHDKEISVIPVKKGNEKMLSRYAEDKFAKAKCEVVMFLLESKEQMNDINCDRCCRFAVIGKNGVNFYKKQDF